MAPIPGLATIHPVTSKAGGLQRSRYFLNASCLGQYRLSRHVLVRTVQTSRVARARKKGKELHVVRWSSGRQKRAGSSPLPIMTDVLPLPGRQAPAGSRSLMSRRRRPGRRRWRHGYPRRARGATPLLSIQCVGQRHAGALSPVTRLHWEEAPRVLFLLSAAARVFVPRSATRPLVRHRRKQAPNCAPTWLRHHLHRGVITDVSS